MFSLSTNIPFFTNIMKFPTISLALLAAFLTSVISSLTPSPNTKRQAGAPGLRPVGTPSTAPTKRDVPNPIISWLIDVVNVGSFINAFSAVANLRAAAAAAYGFTVDEPTQLGRLACIPNPPDAA